MVSALSCIAFAAGCGLAAHQIYRRFEPTIYGFLGTLATIIASFGILTYFITREIEGSIGFTLLFALFYLISLGASIATYRLYFHPLRNYPGPWLAKLTKWYGFYWSTTGHLHSIVPELHRKYGDVVRVGPNELSFANPDAVKDIHGANSGKLPKGPSYGTGLWADGKGMSQSPLPEHKLRRKSWEKGLSSKAIAEYESRILKIIDVFVAKIAQFEGQTVNIGAWIDFFAFDTMGDLAFDDTFGFLEAGKIESLSGFVRLALKMTHLVGNVSWSAPLWKKGYVPVDSDLADNAKAFKEVSKAQFQKRYKLGTKPRDLFSYILRTEEETGLKLSETALASDAPIIIIAGSDTTSVCLTFIFYFITVDPTVQRKLLEEIDAHYERESADPLVGWKLDPKYMPYLNGVINESLRLVPPAPNGNQRTTPPEGHLIDGVHIPPNTQVHSNPSAMQTDPRYFSEPTLFVPERWDDTRRDPTWEHNLKAFIPFSLGQYGCPGKGLAYLEMRLFLVKVLRNFEFEMRGDFDHRGFWLGLRSYMGFARQPLPLKVHKRNRDPKS